MKFDKVYPCTKGEPISEAEALAYLQTVAGAEGLPWPDSLAIHAYDPNFPTKERLMIRANGVTFSVGLRWLTDYERDWIHAMAKAVDHLRKDRNPLL